MKKILWQSRTPVVFNAVQSGVLPAGANGGNAYDFYAAMALKEQFELLPDESAVLRLKDSFGSYWWRMAHHNVSADAIICEPAPVVFGKRNKNLKTVAMIHHIDDDLAGSSFKHRWYFNRLKKRLASTDLIVTVSKYWEAYLSGLGCKKIKIIYNSFAPDDYQITDDEVKLFLEKNNFNKNIPLIYIGNAHRQKGVYEVYHALKEKNYQLVMTGSKNNATDIPVKFLSLNSHDYKCLLKGSDVVITFSKMTEGWNRIAHESMLCHTPVIGSGTGGMRELLEKGNQFVVEDPSLLADVVEKVLKNKKEIGDAGFEFVKRFDKKYFKTEWQNTIEELIGK